MFVVKSIVIKLMVWVMDLSIIDGNIVMHIVYWRDSDVLLMYLAELNILVSIWNSVLML